MKSKFVALMAFSLILGSMAAHAVPITSGTNAYVTFRDCIAGVTACDNISGTLASDVGGNPGDQTASASMADGSYGSVEGTAALTGGVGAATLTGKATSLAGTRNSTNTFALQRYTNTGTSAMNLTFSGLLTFDQTVPAENANFDPNSSSATFSGASIIMDIFTLSDPTLEAGTTAYDNFVSMISYTSAPGYASLASTTSGALSNVTDSGSQSFALSVNLNPSESIWLFAELQTPAVNGAAVDAKFVTSTNVPEPGSLLLLGVGLAALWFGRHGMRGMHRA